MPNSSDANSENMQSETVISSESADVGDILAEKSEIKNENAAAENPNKPNSSAETSNLKEVKEELNVVTNDNVGQLNVSDTEKQLDILNVLTISQSNNEIINNKNDDAQGETPNASQNKLVVSKDIKVNTLNTVDDGNLNIDESMTIRKEAETPDAGKHQDACDTPANISNNITETVVKAESGLQDESLAVVVEDKSASMLSNEARNDSIIAGKTNEASLVLEKSTTDLAADVVSIKKEQPAEQTPEIEPAASEQCTGQSTEQSTESNAPEVCPIGNVKNEPGINEAQKDTAASPANKVAETLQNKNVSATDIDEDNIDEPPDSFFDEVLRIADEIQLDGGDFVTNSTVESTESTAIKNETVEQPPPDFFDDLPQDDLAVQSMYLVKYAELKRELSRLDEDQDSNEDVSRSYKHKKKKSKKSKSHKRSRNSERSHSRSRSPIHKNFNIDDNNPMEPMSETTTEMPRLRVKSEFLLNKPVIAEDVTNSTAADRSSFRSLHVRSDLMTPRATTSDDLLALPIQAHHLFDNTTSFQSTTYCAPATLDNCVKSERIGSPDMMPSFAEKPEQTLSATEKGELALKRASAAKNAILENIQSVDNNKFDASVTSFVHTPTLRKLPTSRNYLMQQIHDNRSPLHTINNVTYRFNSHGVRINVREYGLEPLSEATDTICRALCFDAESLKFKRQTTRIPEKVLRAKEKHMQSKGSAALNESSEFEVIEAAEASTSRARSTFFRHTAAQTDDVTVLAGRRRDVMLNIGIQVRPESSSIGSQTASTGPIANQNTDLPLFRQIRSLNDSQLLALDDFVQLIVEPANDSGIDMYRVRQRLTDIYKTAQSNALHSSASARLSSSASSLRSSPPLAFNSRGNNEKHSSPPPPPPPLIRDRYKHDSKLSQQYRPHPYKANAADPRHSREQREQRANRSPSNFSKEFDNFPSSSSGSRRRNPSPPPKRRGSPLSPFSKRLASAKDILIPSPPPIKIDDLLSPPRQTKPKYYGRGGLRR